MRKDSSSHYVHIDAEKDKGYFTVIDSEGNVSEFYFLELVALSAYTKKIVRRMKLRDRIALRRFTRTSKA